MLCLSRKYLEEIRIGKDITIKILGIEGNKVRIGIEAPKTVSVHRAEVYDMLHSVDGVAPLPLKG